MEDKNILIIPTNVLGIAPYISTVSQTAEKMGVSEESIISAIESGEPLHDCYIDEV